MHYPLLILKEKNLCWHVCVRHPHKLPAYTLLENLTDDALAYVALCDEMFDHFPQQILVNVTLADWRVDDLVRIFYNCFYSVMP